MRIQVVGTPSYSLEHLQANAARNAHYPKIRKTAPHGRRLAVVGGGPLVVHDLPELRAWDGDVWGINFTAQWLNEQGVPATLFTVDPAPFVVVAPRAILATACDPQVIASFDGRVECFDMVQTHPDTGFSGGAFSSSCSASVALHLGYTDVSFFGCEGSFAEQSHVDRNEDRHHQLIVRASGRDYLTIAPYIIQCDELLKLFFFDNVFHNRSGGLLKAMQEDADWDVVGVSSALRDHLIEVNGSTPFNEPYEPL